MRTSTRVAIVSLLIAGGLFGADAPAKDRGTAPPIVLVRAGKATATIVVADDSAPEAKPGATDADLSYAAQELQSFIEKATGARLDIVPASKASDRGNLILVGRSKVTQQFNLQPPTRPEAFRIVAFPRGLAILGEVAPRGTNNIDQEKDRGSLFGVYEFLERVVGYRFYFHNESEPELGMVVPALKDLTIPADFALERAPDFAHRRAAFSTWENPTAWMRVTREGAGTGFHCNHTDEQWGAAYRQAHPEYFLLHKDGTRDEQHLCYSEPAVLKQRLQKIAAFYETGDGTGGGISPGPKYIPFCPKDVMIEDCQCERCRQALQLDRGRFGKLSNLIFAHGKELAAEARTRWPGRRVAMLAYEGYMQPPDFDLPDNLDVMVCMMWSSTMGKEDYWHEHNLKLLQAWSRKVQGKRDRLYVWNYHCWPAMWTKAPLLFPHYLQRWLRETHALSSGEFINPGGNSEQLGHFMAWLWHRLLWDRNADVDALLADYAAKMYGPAARPMQELYQTLSDRYETVKWSRKLGESYVPPDLMYGETYTAPIVQKLKTLSAEALATCPDDPENLYRRRVVWMQRGLAPFFQEADLARRWLDHPPRYTVAQVQGAPDWDKAASMALVQGNFGQEPDLETRVAMLRQGDRVHVQFRCSEPAGVRAKDWVALRMYLGKEEKFLRAGPEGEAQGNLDAAVVANHSAAGVWTVHLTFPTQALGLDTAKGGEFAVQIERHREARKAREKSRDYIWSPQMKPPWNYPPRPGRVVFP